MMQRASVAAALASLGLLMAAGCGTGAAHRYRPMAEGFGLHRALHHAFIRDGDSVELQVSDREGRPIEGLAIVIAADDGPITLISDKNGRLSFPVSSRLLAANDAVEVKRPDGVGRVNMRLTISLHDACDRASRKGATALAHDYERWAHRDFGPDRVYAEAGVSGEAVQQAGEHLAHARALFMELTGAAPPTIGVVITKLDESSTGTPDPAGRMMWRVAEATVAGGESLSTVVHEWTHDVMRQQLPGPDDERSRYIEDGLCEVVSHLAYERARATKGSPVAASRATELATFARQPSFDLVSLALRFSSAAGVTLFDQAAMTCSDVEVTVGYGLGLAFWLEQLDRNPDALRELFAKLHGSVHPGDATLIAASEAISEPPGALHNMVVERAVQTLRAHAPSAGSE